LKEYQHVSCANIEISEHNWRRLIVDGSLHPHSFEKAGNELRTTRISASRDRPAILESGLSDLILLKTTGSSFTNFYHDRYTVLPDIEDRLLGTSATASWRYLPNIETMNYSGVNFDSINSKFREIFIRIFANMFSPSVQHTMFVAAQQTLREVPEILEIQLKLPNIHNWNFDFSKFGLPPTKDLLVPVDEPHGLIMATIRRETARL